MFSQNFLLSFGGLAASILAAAMLAAPAQARTLSYASVYPAGSEAEKAVHEWAEKLEKYTSGDLKAKVYAMSLLSASEISAGVRDAMAGVTSRPRIGLWTPFAKMAATFTAPVRNSMRQPKRS